MNSPLSIFRGKSTNREVNEICIDFQEGTYEHLEEMHNLGLIKRKVFEIEDKLKCVYLIPSEIIEIVKRTIQKKLRNLEEPQK